MYLSDMCVAAYRTGGQERVVALLEILSALPDEWWQFRGCRNWLKVAYRQMQEHPDKFIADLDKYSKSRDWLDGKPFMAPEAT